MKVLLFGNIGTDYKGFYHVGDEAMFLTIYRWYKKNRPQSEITIFSSLESHKALALSEFRGLPWPDKDNKAARSYFLKLISKIFFYKVTNKSLFSAEQYQFVKLILAQDTIHFTGGGNLTSLFVPWLYYSYLIIFIGWLYSKTIILSSQTIGPFWGIERLTAPLFLNLPGQIWLREPLHKRNPLYRYGIFKPDIRETLDSAYSLNSSSQFLLPDRTSVLRIGLSLHRWKKFGPHLKKVVLKIIREISLKQKTEVILIPHVFNSNSDEWDLGFMKKIARDFPSSVSVTIPTYEQLTHSKAEPANTIKYLSGSVDILIATRYHGLVFALAMNVPCITFLMDEYYNQKNQKLLDFYYPSKQQLNRYSLDLGQNSTSRRHLEVIGNLVSNLSREKRILKRRNAELKKLSFSQLMA